MSSCANIFFCFCADVDVGIDVDQGAFLGADGRRVGVRDGAVLPVVRVHGPVRQEDRLVFHARPAAPVGESLSATVW